MRASANTARLVDGLADVVNVIVIQIQKVAGMGQLLVKGEQVRGVVVETKDLLLVLHRQVFITRGSCSGTVNGGLYDRVRDRGLYGGFI